MRIVWPAALSVAAVALALLVMRDCHAADWAQGVSLLGAPLVAAVAAGLAATRAFPQHRAAAGIGVPVLVGVAAFVTVLGVWAGECSR